jgi:hypothetical protein
LIIYTTCGFLRRTHVHGVIYCNGFDQRVAEQRLGKQTATIEGELFPMRSAPSKSTLPGNAAVNMHPQRGTFFPWGPCEGVILKTIGATVQLSLHSRSTDRTGITILLLHKEDIRENESRDSYLTSPLARWLLPNNEL